MQKNLILGVLAGSLLLNISAVYGDEPQSPTTPPPVRQRAFAHGAGVFQVRSARIPKSLHNDFIALLDGPLEGSVTLPSPLQPTPRIDMSLYQSLISEVAAPESLLLLRFNNRSAAVAGTIFLFDAHCTPSLGYPPEAPIVSSPMVCTGHDHADHGLDYEIRVSNGDISGVTISEPAENGANSTVLMQFSH